MMTGLLPVGDGEALFGVPTAFGLTVPSGVTVLGLMVPLGVTAFGLATPFGWTPLPGAPVLRLFGLAVPGVGTVFEPALFGIMVLSGLVVPLFSCRA
jgi:hypothetical protein